VFKNTFTYKGRLREVKRWCVKLQHEGTRRTFSLVAGTRAAAALEARTLYRILVEKGWNTELIPGRSRAHKFGHARAAQPSWRKTDPRHWQQRLLLRKHVSPVARTQGSEFSARFECAEASAYFPLGTLDQAAAARRALEIYQTILQEGWNAAQRQFARELTVAIHWANNPLAWTYATFHTCPNGESERSPTPALALRPASRWPVVLIEADPGIGHALAECLNQHPDFYCRAAFASLEQAPGALPRRSPHLVLLNHHLVVTESFRRLQSLAPDWPVVSYSVHEDSEQLFMATPGGATGYLLKRTSPDKILEPLVGAPAPPSLDQIALWVRRYFQNLVTSLPARDTAPELATLTEREQQVLSFLSKGYVDKEIADALRLSVWTVHGHVKNIFEKLSVHSRTEAVVKFLQK
jgi:DNA-binding NarL/FixJ family response regulator